jgi:hypothetical protein
MSLLSRRRTLIDIVLEQNRSNKGSFGFLLARQITSMCCYKKMQQVKRIKQRDVKQFRINKGIQNTVINEHSSRLEAHNVRVLRCC